MSYFCETESRGIGAIAAHDHALGAISRAAESSSPPPRRQGASQPAKTPPPRKQTKRPAPPRRQTQGGGQVPPPRQRTTRTSAPPRRTVVHVSYPAPRQGPVISTTSPPMVTESVVLTSTPRPLPPTMRPPSMNTGVVPPHMSTGSGVGLPQPRMPVVDLDMPDVEMESQSAPQVTASKKPLIIAGVAAAAVLGYVMLRRQK